MKKTLTTYLRLYSRIQPDITLCHRPSIDAGWGKRCKYLDEKYDSFLPYNHRSILDDEVVIEFDFDDKEQNKQLALKVAERLRRDKIPYSMWYSGGKSTHLHFFVQSNSVRSKSLLKRVVTRYYTRQLETPDMQLTGNHLIRAEYGLHERTGERKRLLAQSRNYPLRAELKQVIWNTYQKEMRTVQKRHMTIALNDLEESELVKSVLNTAYVKEEVGDGRKRLIGALSQILKYKYSDRNELIDFLWDWYRYSGGTDLTRGQVAYQVHYAYNNPMRSPLGFLISVTRDLDIEPDEQQENKEENLLESRKINNQGV